MARMDIFHFLSQTLIVTFGRNAAKPDETLDQVMDNQEQKSVRRMAVPQAAIVRMLMHSAMMLIPGTVPDDYEELGRSPYEQDS